MVKLQLSVRSSANCMLGASSSSFYNYGGYNARLKESVFASCCCSQNLYTKIGGPDQSAKLVFWACKVLNGLSLGHCSSALMVFSTSSEKI